MGSSCFADDEVKLYEPDFNPVPPSPQVEALISLQDIDVDYFRGRPSVSVPIYTVRSGDLEIEAEDITIILPSKSSNAKGVSLELMAFHGKRRSINFFTSLSEGLAKSMVAIDAYKSMLGRTKRRRG